MSDLSNLEYTPLTIEAFEYAREVMESQTLPTKHIAECFGCPMLQKRECSGNREDVLMRFKGRCKMFEG